MDENSLFLKKLRNYLVDKTEKQILVFTYELLLKDERDSLSSVSNSASGNFISSNWRNSFPLISKQFVFKIVYTNQHYIEITLRDNANYAEVLIRSIEEHQIASNGIYYNVFPDSCTYQPVVGRYESIPNEILFNVSFLEEIKNLGNNAVSFILSSTN